MSPRDLRPILERAVARLQARAAALEERVEAGDESAWSAYVETVEALAAVLPQLEPGAHGEPRVGEEAARYSPRVQLIRDGVVIYDGPARWGV